VSGWAVNGGVYQATNTLPNQRGEAAWSSGYSWTSYTAQTDVRFDGTGQPSSAELRVRYQSDVSFTSCQLTQYSGISLGVMDSVHGMVASVSPALSAHTWYTLKATISGSTLRCEVLNVSGAVVSGTVGGPATGTVALRNAQTPVSFDNVLVTSP
jgi:hypothetical protein